MKVIQVNNQVQLGGAETVVHQLRLGLISLGHLASFCISLPTRLKMNSYQEKLVLRAAFSDAWSPAIRKRRKQGFGALVTDWLKRSSVRDLKHSILGNPNSALYDLLAIEQVEKVIEADSYQTWLLLVLGIWLEKQRELGTQQRFRTVASRN